MPCVLAVGNELKGDDYAGILAGKILEKKGFRVIYAYETPVNVLDSLRSCDRIIAIDAAEFPEDRPWIVTKKLDRGGLTHRIGFEEIAKFLGKDIIVVGIKIYERGFGKISEKARKNVEEAVKVVEVCMAKPGIVVDARKGIVEIDNERKKVKMAVPGLKDGDFVLVHAGVVIEKLSREEYEEIKKELEAVEKEKL